MSFYIDNKWFIAFGDNISDKDICINLNQVTYTLLEKNLLVFYRKKFTTKNIKNIDTWMKVFRVLEQPRVFYNIDKQFLGYWMWIYQEFDELKWKNISYLYRFPKEDIPDLNNMLEDFWLDIYADTDGKYVFLENFGTHLEEIFSWINSAIWNKDYKKIFSFIFGLSFVYGDIDINEDKINCIKLNIPFEGSLLGFEKSFEDLIWFLKINWFVLNYNKKNKDIWFEVQLIILDWEIIESLVSCFSFLSGFQNCKKDLVQKYIRWINDFVGSEFLPESSNLKVFEK